MREEVEKLEQLDWETLLLVREGITTIRQLKSRKRAAKSKIKGFDYPRPESSEESAVAHSERGATATDELRRKIEQLSQQLKKF